MKEKISKRLLSMVTDMSDNTRTFLLIIAALILAAIAFYCGVWYCDAQNRQRQQHTTTIGAQGLQTLSAFFYPSPYDILAARRKQMKTIKNESLFKKGQKVRVKKDMRKMFYSMASSKGLAGEDTFTVEETQTLKGGVIKAKTRTHRADGKASPKVVPLLLIVNTRFGQKKFAADYFELA